MHLIAPAPQVIAWANLVSSVATSIGILIAMTVFLRDRIKHRRDRETTAYAAMSAQFKEYLRRCIEDPELATVDTAFEDQRKQDLHISMVISMLESAYFMYREQNTEFRRRQWNGWIEYMRLWCVHPEFQKRWWYFMKQFDKDFMNQMTMLYEEELGTLPPFSL